MSLLLRNIKKAREMAGISQKDMGQYLGLSRENYNALENCRRGGVSDNLMEKISLIPGIGLSVEQMKVWRALDEYPELMNSDEYEKALAMVLEMKGNKNE